MPTPDNVHTRAYPFANEVVFASIEEPEGPLKDFLSWIMTPAGQVVVRRYLAPVRN
jgi:phosphate transport system substrate-binding protein